VEEVTGTGTPRAAGGGVQARRERCAEITSGTAPRAQCELRATARKMEVGPLEAACRGGLQTASSGCGRTGSAAAWETAAPGCRPRPGSRQGAAARPCSAPWGWRDSKPLGKAAACQPGSSAPSPLSDAAGRTSTAPSSVARPAPNAIAAYGGGSAEGPHGATRTTPEAGSQPAPFPRPLGKREGCLMSRKGARYGHSPQRLGSRE
jgi:hypothetical protein